MTKTEMEDAMSRNHNISFFVGASLVLGVISTSAVAQSKNPNMAATRDAYAYSQVFTDPQDATCPNPKHRKVKTSKGYKWRWVC
jgi:hypothetical protein